ncbi:MAG: hypothetical protein GXP45_00485 [bacterium]|nr:hypothetical protein [bacterium]
MALIHYDKHFILKKNNKLIFDLPAQEDILERINSIFKKDISKNLNPLQYQNERIELSGLVSDPHLRYGSGEHIHIFVNERAISDKIIKRAILDAYKRQISP